MQHRPRTVRRLIGAGALAAVLVTASSCTAGTQQQAAPPESPAPTTAHGGHGGQFSAPPAAPLRPGERYQSLDMPAAYTPTAPGGGTDEYRCFLVDPKLSASAFLTGSQFLPQNADIVHHAIFFQVPPSDVAAARQADAAAPGEGWTCFGNTGIGDNAAWVAHWAPGANETLLQPDIGHPMPAGSQLVMQVHYNLLSTAGKAGSSDRSGVRLRLSDRSDLTPLRTATLAAPVELACAANESGPLCDRRAAVKDVGDRFGAEASASIDQLNQGCNPGRTPRAASVQHCDHPMPAAATVYATAGHMHLLGRSIKLELNPGRTGARTLLDIPSYDFDDQALRPLATPVTVKKGDVLRVTCAHDVTLRQQISQLKPLPPRYVVWGEGTSDEMCLGLVVMAAAG